MLPEQMAFVMLSERAMYSVVDKASRQVGVGSLLLRVSRNRSAFEYKYVASVGSPVFDQLRQSASVYSLIGPRFEP